MFAAEARPSLYLSKCYIVGNLMHWLNYVKVTKNFVKGAVFGVTPAKSQGHQHVSSICTNDLKILGFQSNKVHF